VNPNGTSKICSNCGIDVSKTLAVRMHRCPSCGFEIHRDVNSALNILNRATVGLTGSHACEDRVRPLKASADKASVVEAGTICE
jgi:transposase